MVKKYGFLIAMFLVSLAGVISFNTWYRVAESTSIFIANDIDLLGKVFEKIDKDCSIISFDGFKNTINFLNVIKFSGSEVGPMNLTYPKDWHGPYLKDNPTVQKIEYQVINTHKGYFIVPGDGVKLPNGKTIGSDIILTQKSDVALMMRDNNLLAYKDVPLGVKITLNKTKERNILVSVSPEDMLD